MNEALTHLTDKDMRGWFRYFFELGLKKHRKENSMTDKVQKIREEVERLINELIQERGKYYSSDVDDACILELQNVLTYIDSMQEEPTSVWHDANTLPSSPKAVIVEHNEYSTSICRAEQMSRVKGAKWAYIDDLIKL